MFLTVWCSLSPPQRMCLSFLAGSGDSLSSGVNAYLLGLLLSSALIDYLEC